MTHDPFDAEEELSATLVAGSKEEQKTLLCYRCRSLDLSVGKFIIGGGSSIGISHDPQRYEPRKAKETFHIKSGRNWKHFQTLERLFHNRLTCRLCGLIYRAITRYGKGKVSDTTLCSLIWEVHGRQAQEHGNELINRTRRIRLSWDDISGHQQEVYLMLVAPQDPLRPNSDASAKGRKDNHFLGRRIGDQKTKQALIKSWIDLCGEDDNDHLLCQENHGTSSAFLDLIQDSYFGVIDVADMQLKPLPAERGRHEPFVALSYVWGRRRQDEPPYVTTRRTVMTHILHGGLETAWEKLPRTIQDAILLVSRLGYRYLWIDSLCIVQDSKTSWQLNAGAMHLVYGNAHFTICAADGEDSSVGLRAVKSALGTMRSATDKQDAMASLNEAENPGRDLMSAECAPGVRLMVTRPLEAVVSDSVWSQRAWTFQERILSRRCLIFAEGRVYWQCRAMSISEDIHPDGSSNGLSLDLATSPFRALQELQRRPLWSYMSYVRMYTGRLLTKQSDVLAAFRGTSWLLERYMNTPFLFGLPLSHFDLAFLWTPLVPLKQRRPGHSSQTGQRSCTADEFGNCTCRAQDEPCSDEEFPTWSWAGRMGARLEYSSGMLDGCFDNVREWLVNHTWIQWHIRDEKGHLLPLHDVSLQKHDSPLRGSLAQHRDDGVWGGYPIPRFPVPGQANAPIILPNQKHLPLRKIGRSTEVRFTEPPHKRIPTTTTEVFDSSTSTSSSKSPSWSELPLPDSPSTRRAPSAHKHRKSIRRQSSSTTTSSETETSLDSERSHTRLRGGRNYQPDEVAEEPYSATREEYQVAESTSTSTASLVEIIENRDYVENVHSLAYQPEMAQYGAHNAPHWGDNYGRSIPSSIPQPTEFAAILPENPFRVVRRIAGGTRRPVLSTQLMPILQFWTWRCELHVVMRGAGVKDRSKKSDAGLCQCDIVDTDGDWCGSINLDEQWIRTRQASLFTFIAISDAKRFTRNECPVWTYYIPKEREESEWDLYYVLLLERNDERKLWERVGLGKVFQAAFRNRSWAEIKLG